MMNIITGSINGILVKLYDTNIIPMHWTRTFTNHCDRGSDWSLHSSAGGSSACVVPSASSVGAGASAATSSSASSAGTSSSSAEGRKEAMSKLTHWCLKNNGCQLADNISLERRCIYYTPCFNEVERGVYWFHLVRLWTESCPLCIFNNTHRIHFIFAHLFKQPQKVLVSKYKNLKFWRIL